MVKSLFTDIIQNSGNGNVSGGDDSIVVITAPNVIITNIEISAGDNISISSENVITNTAPDLVVTINGSESVQVTGNYPNFHITTQEAYTKTESDALLLDKAALSEVYTKSDVDTLLENVDNANDGYTQTEIDTRLFSLNGYVRYPPVQLTFTKNVDTRIGSFHVTSSPDSEKQYEHQAFNRDYSSAYVSNPNSYNQTTGFYEGSVETEGDVALTKGAYFELKCENGFILKLFTLRASTWGNLSEQTGRAKSSPRDFSVFGKKLTEDDFVLIKKFNDIEAAGGSPSDFLKPDIFKIDENEMVYNI
jgi:hypothetical protein